MQRLARTSSNALKFESAHPVDSFQEANVVFARLAHRRLGAHRIQARVEESDPADEELGSGK